MAPTSTHYDVIVSGARCAGASTAMLLARKGLRVLLVDRAAPGADTLSTHALMRSGVLQLRRWGLLDAIRGTGATPIRSTHFHYGERSVAVDIKPKHGVDALFAPRRTVLDPLLQQAAMDAGAELLFNTSLVDVLRDFSGRVNGARLRGRGGAVHDVSARWVIGADGRQSRLADLVAARFGVCTRHKTATVYGHFDDVDVEGYHWHYRQDLAGGVIPTAPGRVCVFVGMPPSVFPRSKSDLAARFFTSIERIGQGLPERMLGAARLGPLRGFAGAEGYLKRCAGPGWALVGDAGYFKDPVTAHGISDALRDAELVAQAIAVGSPEALAEYQQTRDRMSLGLLQASDAIASFAWDLSELAQMHLLLSREMSREAAEIAGWDDPAVDTRQPSFRDEPVLETTALG